MNPDNSAQILRGAELCSPQFCAGIFASGAATEMERRSVIGFRCGTGSAVKFSGFDSCDHQSNLGTDCKKQFRLAEATYQRRCGKPYGEPNWMTR